MNISSYQKLKEKNQELEKNILELRQSIEMLVRPEKFSVVDVIKTKLYWLTMFRINDSYLQGKVTMSETKTMSGIFNNIQK